MLFQRAGWTEREGWRNDMVGDDRYLQEDEDKKGDDRYEIKVPELGKGGQGCVYLATDMINDCLVAIKLLNSETSSEMTFLRRLLLEEAKLQRKLSTEKHPHPNIVYITDFRTINGEPAI